MVENKKYAIIDFETTEVVRGSFGYDSYLLYSDMKQKEIDVDFYEDATPYKFHKVEKDYDCYIIHLWSYPQLNNVEWFLMNCGNKNIKFIGYKPLIEKLGFKTDKDIWNNDVIYNGMKYIPHIFKDMKYGLLSDCDLHIKSDDKRRVFPIFLSYGCPNQCKFCPIPANRKDCVKKRVGLDIEDCKYVLDTLLELYDCNIHFSDEDMLMNIKTTEEIIDYLIYLTNDKYKDRKKLKWIGLASVPTFKNYLEKFGVKKLEESGCHLIEIGIESTDAKLRQEMNKTGSQSDVEYILNNSESINKFWLSVTLFPGETISTINNIGKWLKEHGTQDIDFKERLITNGNTGGLGQFFQLYDSVEDYTKLKNSGITIDEEPLRLVPSFIPYSFLHSEMVKINDIKEDDKKWFKQYNIDIDKYKHITLKGTVESVIEQYGIQTDVFKYKNTVERYKMKHELKKLIIYICLLARLNIIEGKNDDEKI